MKNIKKFLFVLLVITILFISSSVSADTTVNLDIETDTGSIYNQEINVAPCDSEGDGVMKETAYCALFQSGIASDWSGLWVNSIGGITNIAGTEENNYEGIYWMWLANLNIDNTYSDFTCHQDSPYSCSAKQYILNSNDKILFYYNTNPLNISVNNLNPTVGDNITINVKELGLDGWNPVWNNALGGKIIIDSNTYDLDANGAYSLLISNDTPFEIKGQKDGFIDTSLITITPSLPPLPPPPETPHIISSGSSGSKIYQPVPKSSFDIKRAFDFLSSQQKIDSSFGEDIYTDWATIALSSNPEISRPNLDKLAIYFAKNKLNGTLLTDYERHAMALMSLGMNPYYANSENYIEKITSSFDGAQFGDATQDNDDIFALIVLQNAGYTQDEKMIIDTINFILSKQKENGSWDENVDMTGAGMEAISVYKENEKVKTALDKARKFLEEKKINGNWENISSTAWALQGILALDENTKDSAREYFGENQDEDGSVKVDSIQNKIWQTSYVLTSLSGKTWNQIMQKFEKPKIEPEIEIAQIPQKETIKAEEKKIVKVIKNDKKKLENLATQIVTAPIKAVIDNLDEEKMPEPVKKESWFRRLIKKIFSIF